MSNDLYAVIMAGGKGERFWPLSTSKHPKQVLSLFGGKPMLAMAVEYVRGLVTPDHVFVITSADLVDATREAAPELPRENVIGEPVGRDTAAVCALGSALVKARNPDGVFCVLTADHVIQDIEIFQATMREGVEIARNADVLITIGIQPGFPSTGFGYIEADELYEYGGKAKFRKARRFVEKPNIATAEEYFRLGYHFWNSGIFIWSVKSFQKALSKYQPELLQMAERILPSVGTPGFAGQLRKEYEKIARISVDYAVMEKSSNIIMAQGTFRWDDVGSWLALQNHFQADASGNVLIGDCEQIDASGNVVVSSERLTALIGVKDVIVVQAGNATLVCAKERAQDVKKIVQLLAAKGKYEELL